MVFPQYMKINTFYHHPLLNVSERKLQAWCMASLFNQSLSSGRSGGDISAGRRTHQTNTKGQIDALRLLKRGKATVFWLAKPFNSWTLVFQKSKPLCLWVSQENNNSHSLGEWPQGNPILSCNQSCCISKPRKLHNAPINIIVKQKQAYSSVFSLVLSAVGPYLLF